MKDPDGSVASYYERIRSKAPEYVSLLTAETEEEFEAAFIAVLEKAVIHLEKNKKNFVKLDEEGLTGVLAGTLTIPGLTVTQESNSNGHVDVLIEADHSSPAWFKLGEAKIYSGPAYHIKGVGQLLGRYTTGRETQGLLLNYVRKPDIKELTKKLEKEMNNKLPEKQRGACKAHALKWSLVTNHEHSSGEELAVSHIGINLNID